MFCHPGRGKVVGLAADSQDERIVGQFTAIDQHLALDHHRRQPELPARRIQRVDLARDVLEMMLPCMRQVMQLLLVHVPGAGGEGVQHRLPDVGRTAIDQHDAGLAGTTQQMPQPGCQGQSGNSAAGDQYGAYGLHEHLGAIVGGSTEIM
jgi:hypothetical protein